MPTCDGGPHTVSVAVPTAGEPFRVGGGFAVATVVIDDDGTRFEGLDHGDIENVDG